MKTIKKIGSLLLASAFLVGCSDDDVAMNSTSATVGFESSEMTVKESADLFSIPVVVDGEQNGAVKVTLSVEGYGSNPAEEDVNYLVTDKTLTISHEDKQIGFELRALDDKDINETRKFIVKIVSADGAKLDESRSAVIVSLKDNDANFYEKMSGKWNFTSDGEKMDAEIGIYDESDPKYEKEMVLTVDYQGLPLQFTLKYKYDIATNKITLGLPLGKLVIGGLNFTGIGVCDVFSGVLTEQGPSMKGTFMWNVSEDMQTITMDPSLGALGGLVLKGSDYMGYFFAFSNPVLTR